MKRRLLSFVLCLVTAIGLLPGVTAAAKEVDSPEIASTAAVVWNLESESALFEKNLTARLNPAAFTKLMTSLLAFEYREKNGNVTVTVTEEMLSSAGGTTMNLKAGEILPFDSLLAGLVVQNANDAALVLASVTGGSISSFVDLMNNRAKSLGMEQTYYANPTGVDTATMYTTMEDTLLLCKALYRVNDFMVLSEQAKVVIGATNLTKERTYTNKNAVVPFSYITDYYLPGVRGMVAGYTGGAGYCVATTRHKNNQTFLVIVSGGEDKSEKQNGTDITSYRDAKTLLEWAEENFAIQTLVEKGKIIREEKVRLGAGVDHMILVTGEAWKGLLPKGIDAQTEITYRIQTDKEVFTAPITQGQPYGTMEIVYENKVIGTVPLVAQSNVALSRWLVVWDAITGFFSQGPAKVVLILAIVAATGYVLILIGTVWVQYLRKNRDRALAIAEITKQENRRMKKVREKEKRASDDRKRRLKVAIREGYRVLSGETEVVETRRKNAPPQRKAVAKVPEKYRKAPAQNSGRPQPGARPGNAPQRVRQNPRAPGQNPPSKRN